MENGIGDLHIMTLPNGFTLFVKEDKNAALFHTIFVCKAGISCQSPINTGFFTLFQRNFALNLGLQGECNADSSSYENDCTDNEFEDFLSILSQNCIKAEFSDEQIKSSYNSLKKEVKDYAASTSGFINSAIDSRVFYKEPWKQDSGIYPALFCNYNEAEVRTFLSDIADRYYRPDNSALFVSGNIKSEKVYALATKYFSAWEGKAQKEKQSIEKNYKKSEQKKFVLTDPSFSPQLTQIVVQYTDLSMAEADILSAAFNSAHSNYKEIQLANPVVAIRSKDYLAAASAQKSWSSRLILQALMEEPFSFSKDENLKVAVSPAQQAAQFCQGLERASELSPSLFSAACNAIEAKYREESGNPITAMRLLSSWWALDSSFSAEGFYAKFLTAAHASESLDKEDLSKKFKQEVPYVFLLVNSEVYKKNKKSFDEGGWEEVTNKNASWYSTELAAKKAVEDSKQKEETLEKTVNPDFNEEEINQAEYFYYKNLPLLKSGNLANGIPLTVKSVAHSQTVSLNISISGGELASPKDELLLRSVMINYFARNIQSEIAKKKAEGLLTGNPKASSHTDNFFSTISVQCLSCDLEQTFTCITDAIIYGDIKPVMADSLANEIKAQRASFLIGLSNQLEYNAFKYLFRNTELEHIYDSAAQPLEKTTISSITREYTYLLDASLYSISAVGDISYEQIEKAASLSFGLLHEQKQRESLKVIEPSFKNKNRNVQLRHLYATDKTPEMAPNGVPILVPTKDFFDPAHFYFTAPVFYSDAESLPLYNAILKELELRIQGILGPEIKCKASYAKEDLAIGALKVDALLHTKAFLNAYQKARYSLLKDLTNEDVASQEKSLRKMKNLWIKQTMALTQTNSGTADLIEIGQKFDQADLYMKNYIRVENASAKDFVDLIEKYFTETPTFTVYSVDSKK